MGFLIGKQAYKLLRYTFEFTSARDAASCLAALAYPPIEKKIGLRYGISQINHTATLNL